MFSTIKSMLAAILTGSLLWLVALVVTAFAVAEIAEDFSSLSWPTVTGKILSGPSVTTNRRNTIYRVNISYTYAAAGEIHKSSRIRRTSSSSDYFYWQSTADDAAARFADKPDVTVYYPPDQPYLGILDPGLKIFSVIVLLIGLAASALALAYTQMLAHKRRKAQPRP